MLMQAIVQNIFLERQVQSWCAFAWGEAEYNSTPSRYMFRGQNILAL